MENKQEEIPGYVPPGEPKRWFHNGWFSRSFLIVAGLFFLLPFIDIRCGGAKLASVKGIDMVIGKELKMDSSSTKENEEEIVAEDTTGTVNNDNKLMDSFNFSDKMFEKGDQKNIAPNIAGITAFASVIMALLFTFFNKRIPVIISGGLALLGALALFFIQIHISNEVETKLGPFNFMALTFEFTVYYWTCIFLMALAAVFSFVRSSVLKK